MSATPVSPAPSHSIVPYQTPNARALQATGTTATGFLIALGLAVIPLLIAFLNAGSFNRTALIALASAVGIAALSVVTTYLIKLSQARGSDVPPSVLPDGTAPLAPADFIHGDAAVFAPPITAATLRDLLETVDVLQQWQRPVAPNAAIGHRIVTEPPAPASVPPGAFAPVKRSHHAAKVPTVAPLDTTADH